MATDSQRFRDNLFHADLWKVIMVSHPTPAEQIQSAVGRHLRELDAAHDAARKKSERRFAQVYEHCQRRGMNAEACRHDARLAASEMYYATQRAALNAS